MLSAAKHLLFGGPHNAVFVVWVCGKLFR